MNAQTATTEGVRMLSISLISRNGTQSRKEINARTISDICYAIKDRNSIDPIIVFFDGTNHWIGDGYHRLEAHLKEKREVISAEVRRGSREEALRFNVETNANADKTRWTNDDKRNAVTMLLESGGHVEIPRALADEIASLAKCHAALVYKIASEIKDGTATSARPTSEAAPQSKIHTTQVVKTETIPEDTADIQEETKPKTDSTPRAPAGRRSLEMAERDGQIAALAAEGLNQAAIARQLNVSTGTVSDSFRRQKLTQETANPLVKVLERARLAAADWESIFTALRDGSGAAANWHTATRKQKEEVIGYINEAIGFQKNFINRLNKEAKG